MGDFQVKYIHLNKWLEKIERSANVRGVINWFTLATGFLYGEFDDRLDLRSALQKVLKKPVPKHINFWFCFGGFTFLLFFIHIITGILLLMYYRPTIDQAYDSIVHITNNVPFGWLVRGFHHWAANIMVITVLIHMLRIYFHGAYKHPRDMNWVVGVCLFLLVLSFGFTGYLLPWNQVSFWATTIGAEIPSTFPLAGPYITYFLKGGDSVGQLALTRFFAFHVVILPWITVGLLSLHFLMVRRLGISGPL